MAAAAAAVTAALGSLWSVDGTQRSLGYVSNLLNHNAVSQLNPT